MFDRQIRNRLLNCEGKLRFQLNRECIGRAGEMFRISHRPVLGNLRTLPVPNQLTAWPQTMNVLKDGSRSWNECHLNVVRDGSQRNFRAKSPQPVDPRSKVKAKLRLAVIHSLDSETIYG